MNTLTIRKQLDRLNNRRNQIAIALQHLRRDENQAERGADWLDRAAFESRVDFADRLSHWYLTEIAQIDKAIARIERRRYGFCLACHDPIETPRLATAPEAEFCSSCQQLREDLHRA